MEPRYSRQLSPPRRYAHPGRNSTGRLDADYESYYQPRGSRESIIPGPRTSTERIFSRGESRLVPASRSGRDEYYVPPRYAEPVQGDRRPMNIITQIGPSSRYRPVISSAVDLPSGTYGRTKVRDDESYYIEPASSSGHNRHVSAGSGEMPRYVSDVGRDRERNKPAYRSSGLRRTEYLSPTLPLRDTRDYRERDSGYEYASPREEVYHDTAPRSRTRRVSDLGSRDKPTGISAVEDNRRQQGPPIPTRGLAKIEDDGLVRREYRYPRDVPSTRETTLSRGSREERDRLKSSRGLVAIHQDDGYSSNVDERSPDKSHRHKHRDSADRDRYVEGERRVEEPPKKYNRTESEDRRTRHHRTDSEDRHYKPQRHREDSEEVRTPRDDEQKERRRRGDEPRKDKHDERKLVEGLAVGAAGIGAANSIAENLKPKQEKDASDLDSETRKDRPRRRRHREEADGERAAGGGEEGEEDRRERRRRRRRQREERDERERFEKEDLNGSTNPREEEPRDRHGRIIPIVDPREAPPNDGKDGRPEEADERTSRRRRRRHRQRTSSSDTESTDDDEDQSRVRVVSPARDSSSRPKSILRLPTQKFPEDPAPIREGVAPLKDAGKKGIPVNARWTKIDRRLVNPEALELGNERYEARPENVIVLRVLTKEEIEKYATITQELRCKF